MRRHTCKSMGLVMLTVAAWSLPRFVHSQPAAQTKAKPAPVAFVTFGGNSATAPANQGITDLVAWAIDAGPRFQCHHIKRVHWQNPGGIWPGVDAADGREMRVDQWLRAEKAGLSFADRDQLRTAVCILAYYGVTENIMYIGSPTQLRDVERELPACVAAFVDAGPGVSIGFDAAFYDGMEPNSKRPEVWRRQWAPNSPYTRALIALRKRLNSNGGKLYVEPRLTDEHLKAGLGWLIDGTMASNDANPSHPFDLAKQPGESLRVTATQNHKAVWADEIKDWTVTPMLRSELNWGPLMDRGAK
jgi:hypothetical protein